MIQLDPRTTILIGSITCGLMALVLTLLRRASPLPVTGFLAWVFGAWLTFFALFFLGLRDRIPDVASVVLGNAALLLGYVLWFVGTLEHLGGRANWRNLLLILVAAVSATTWFSFVHENFRLRVVIVAGLCAAINAQHLFVLVRAPRAARFGQTIGITSVVSWLSALTCVYGLRAVHAVAFPQGPSSLLEQSGVQVAYIACFTICNLMLVLGFATMASDDVRARIEEQATRDPLTCALNRRALADALARELSRCRRGGHPLSVLMLDVDHFKKVNDEFGHPVGDRVLVHLCGRLAALMRPHDVFARYGGEEFLIALPETDATAAKKVAQRILFHLAAADDSGLPQITVSIGISEWTDMSETAESLIARADQALYIAKQNGRNRIELTVDENAVSQLRASKP